MNKIHGLLFDVESNPGSVKEIDVEEDLNSFYDVLNCNTIEIVSRKIGGKYYCVVCDEEGTFKENPIESAFDHGRHPIFVGNLFICNREGEHLSNLSKEDIINIFESTFVCVRAYKDGSRKVYPALINVGY